MADSGWPKEVTDGGWSMAVRIKVERAFTKEWRLKYKGCKTEDGN
jgi:hypothetical protein